MTAGVAHDQNWINFTQFRVSLVLGMLTYLLGVAMLILIAVPLLLYLCCWWLRDGVWHSYSLAEVLERASTADNMLEAGITTWLFEMSLLAVASAVGGLLTVSGFAIIFGIGLMVVRREGWAEALADAKRRSPWKSLRSALTPDW
jgi:hypothetical protein